MVILFGTYEDGYAYLILGFGGDFYILKLKFEKKQDLAIGTYWQAYIDSSSKVKVDFNMDAGSGWRYTIKEITFSPTKDNILLITGMYSGIDSYYSHKTFQIDKETNEATIIRWLE